MRFLLFVTVLLEHANNHVHPPPPGWPEYFREYLLRPETLTTGNGVIRHFFTAQFVGFLAVGTSAAAVNWLARLVLNTWMPFSWAVAIAYGVGMLVAFLLNSFFIFPRSVRPRSAQARDFVLTNLVFLPLVVAVAIQANVGLQLLGMHRHSEELAHSLALAVPTLATFLIYKFVAFKEKIDC